MTQGPNACPPGPGFAPCPRPLAASCKGNDGPATPQTERAEAASARGGPKTAAWPNAPDLTAK
eukprot:123444-Lingulodinium_polyedra.AAC.1